MMCPEEDYSTVVETLAIDDILIRVGIEETKSQWHYCFKQGELSLSSFMWGAYFLIGANAMWLL